MANRNIIIMIMIGHVICSLAHIYIYCCSVVATLVVRFISECDCSAEFIDISIHIVIISHAMPAYLCKFGVLIVYWDWELTVVWRLCVCRDRHHRPSSVATVVMRRSVHIAYGTVQIKSLVSFSIRFRVKPLLFCFLYFRCVCVEFFFFRVADKHTRNSLNDLKKKINFIFTLSASRSHSALAPLRIPDTHLCQTFGHSICIYVSFLTSSSGRPITQIRFVTCHSYYTHCIRISI